MQIYDMPGNQAPYSSELNPLSFFLFGYKKLAMHKTSQEIPKSP